MAGLRERFPRLQIYLAAALFALSLLYVGGRSIRQGPGNDAAVFYYAGQLLFRGENPYDASVLHQKWVSTLAEGNTRPAPVPFVNPPIVAVLMAPVLPFPVQTAMHLFALLNFSCLLVCVYFLDRVFCERMPPAIRLLLATWVVMMPPIMRVFSWGQSALLVCAPLALALYSFKRKRELQACFWLALSLAKFTITLPFLLVLMLRGRWRAAFTTLTIFGVINLAFSLPLGLGNILTSYRASIASVDGIDKINDPFSALALGPENIVSIKRLLILIIGPDRTVVNVTVWIVTAVLVAIFMFLIRKKHIALPVFDDPLESALAIMLALEVMYHRVYDLAALMFVIYGLASYRLQNPGVRPQAWRAAMATLFFLSFFVIGTGWSRPVDYVLSKLSLPPSPQFGSVFVFLLLVQIMIMIAMRPTARVPATTGNS